MLQDTGYRSQNTGYRAQVMAAGVNDPEQPSERGGGEDRRRNGGREAGGVGTLRRSGTCNDLAMMQLDCTPAQGHKGIDWRNVARLAPHADQDVDLLRYRARSNQCRPGIHLDHTTKRTP